MVRMEREIAVRMREGTRRDYSDPMLVSPPVRIATEDRHPGLNASQRQAVDTILLSREKVVGLDGIAGAGKTTTLSIIREGAEAEGYRLEGFAPRVSCGTEARRRWHRDIHATKASRTPDGF
jgi:ABC-type glutathione transport system ATPase component